MNQYHFGTTHNCAFMCGDKSVSLLYQWDGFLFKKYQKMPQTHFHYKNVGWIESKPENSFHTCLDRSFAQTLLIWHEEGSMIFSVENESNLSSITILWKLLRPSLIKILCNCFLVCELRPNFCYDAKGLVQVMHIGW